MSGECTKNTIGPRCHATNKLAWEMKMLSPTMSAANNFMLYIMSVELSRLRRQTIMKNVPKNTILLMVTRD